MRQMTKRECAYYDQVQLVSDLWKTLVDMADMWIESENYDALREHQAECERQEEKQHFLYLQAYCKHENAHDSDDRCPDCYLKFDQFTV